MALAVCNGAMLQCSFGTAPGPLTVLPANRVMVSSQPMANIMDNKPIVNIPSFGLCSWPVNPPVATATAAAMGTLTPMPCVPNIAAPWVPGAPTAMVGNLPALDNNSKLMCNWGGVIKVIGAGQGQTQVP